MGNERGKFLYRSGNETRNVSGRTKSDAIALIFARDKDKSSGIISVLFMQCSFFDITFSNMHTFSIFMFNRFMDNFGK